MSDKNSIRHIIFDLGAVLLNIDFQRTIDAFAALGIAPQQLAYHRAAQSVLFHDLEKGQISEAEFYQALQAIAPTAAVQDLENAWCALIGDFPVSRLDWLKSLGATYQLYILSNTNSIHIRRFEAIIEMQFGWKAFSEIFKGIGYSHDLNARKPDAEIYEKFLEHFAINRREAVFVDDTLDNVIAANALGLRSFHLDVGMDVTREFAVWLKSLNLTSS